MILYYSGGGSPWIPEMQLEAPNGVMLSFYVNAKKGKGEPDARFRRMLEIRRKARKKGKK